MCFTHHSPLTTHHSPPPIHPSTTTTAGRIEAFVEKVDGKFTESEVLRSYLVKMDVKLGIVERWLRDARKAVVNEYSELLRKRFAEMRVSQQVNKG